MDQQEDIAEMLDKAFAEIFELDRAKHEAALVDHRGGLLARGGDLIS